MRTTAAGQTGARRRTAVGAAVAVVLLLAGCSAASDDASSAGDQAVSEAAGDAFAPSGAAGSTDLADDGTGTGVGTAVSADAAGRQVITTGDIGLVADDPLAAVDAVVQAVESAGGRVDGRQQSTDTSAAADPPEGDAAGSSWATLTVRVPADQVTPTLDALEQIGTVSSMDVSSQDVTGTAQDLDARIRATQISVQRLEDLLARATTSADVIAAEQTLSERQSSLEQLESERARLAEQVALSTLTIRISADPAALQVAAEDEDGFLDGLAAGWDALLAALRVALVVIGAVLPWAALGGLVLAVVLGVRRWLRARRPAAAEPEPEPVPVPVLPGGGSDLPRAPEAPGSGPRR